MDWDDYRVFLSVLDRGSLAAGARALGLTQPTARRRLERLEAALGAVLLTRSAGGVTPTAIGLRVAAQARTMAAAAATAERDATLSGEAVSGRVRLTVPNFMGLMVLPSILADLRRAHPSLTIELDLSDKSVDLLRRDADIAVRMVQPQQEALVARRLPDIELAMYASRAYLGNRALPRNLEELANAFDIIAPDRSEVDQQMLASLASLAPDGRPLKVALRTDNHVVHMKALRAGMGVGMIQRPVGDTLPELVRLLPDYRLVMMPMWLVMHEDLRNEPRMRAVFDHLAAALTSYAKGETEPLGGLE